MLSTGVSLPVTSKTMSTAHQTPSPPSVSSLPTPVGMWPSANLCNILFISFIISPPSVSSLPIVMSVCGLVRICAIIFFIKLFIDFDK